MAQQAHSIIQLHQAFYDYLTKKFDGDTMEAELFMETAERIIPNTLNDYFGTHIASIYDLQDAEEVESYRRKIKAEPVLKGIDMSVEPRYTEVLKWYKLFVKGLNSDTIPVPVPGEYKADEEKEEQPTIVADGKPLPKIQTTIFTEGSDDGAITQEHRRRNMELREACIEIFKARHGGRIVCECCGFDFARAYAISDEYIEVHHRFPFSQTEGEHPVNADTDLVPLCANCHRMIHHGMGGRGKCMTLEKLKEIYRGKHYDN